MSLMAACFTKSSVFGVMPSVEFMPVFSPMDCAMAGVPRSMRARHGARYFILGSFLKMESSVSLDGASLRSARARALPAKALVVDAGSGCVGCLGVDALSERDRIELGVG